MQNENLYGWLITYSPYEDEWKAVTRDNYFSLFSGGENILRVKGIGNIMSLIDIINRTNGDEAKLKQLVA